jgi:hypothetical protein
MESLCFSQSLVCGDFWYIRKHLETERFEFPRQTKIRKKVSGLESWLLSDTFNNISAISWPSVYWWRKPEYQKKTTDLSQVTGKPHSMKLHRVHLSMDRNSAHDSSVISTDCIGCHTIATSYKTDRIPCPAPFLPSCITSTRITVLSEIVVDTTVLEWKHLTQSLHTNIHKITTQKEWTSLLLNISDRHRFYENNKLI